MRIALLADIHANLEALEACLAHARPKGAERFAFLGDLVGYGADPTAVLEIVAPRAAQGIYDLMQNLGAPLALKDIGMKETELDRAAALATTAPYFNPRRIDRDSIRALLDDAFFGRRPQ